MRCGYPERMRAIAKESMWGNARNLVGDSTPLRRRARRRPKPQRRSPPRSHGLCACRTDLSSALSKHLLAEKAQQFNTYTTRGDTPTRTRTPRHATPRHATPRHATPRHATPRLQWAFVVRAACLPRAPITLAPFSAMAAPLFGARGNSASPPSIRVRGTRRFPLVGGEPCWFAVMAQS